MNQGPENMVEVRYQLPNYKELMKNFPCPVFNVIGNHDNDPKVVGDYFTELPFKQHMLPPTIRSTSATYTTSFWTTTSTTITTAAAASSGSVCSAIPTRRNGRWHGWPKT